MYTDKIFEKDEHLLKRWMNRFTPEVLLEILEIKRADNMATGNMSEALKHKFDEIGQMMQDILARQQCFSIKNLAVSGRDIISLGIDEGPQVGAVLQQLLDAVIDGEIENDREQLTALADGLIRDRS